MKAVINGTFGGFELTTKCLDAIGWGRKDRRTSDKNKRSDPKLVAYCTEHPEESDNRRVLLRIVDIPDNATDWRILEYDGAESVIAVVDGQIVDVKSEIDWEKEWAKEE